jgi:hypothetical protein
MVRNIKIALGLAALALAFGSHPTVYAQDSMQHESKTKTLGTGTFHGKVHSTSGRATIYQEEDGKLVLRLTNFKTSMVPMSMSFSSQLKMRMTTLTFSRRRGTG